MTTKTKPYDIFFVDDDDKILKLLSEELQKINCRVKCFTRGEDCLELLGKENCYLLITDVKMPGMDGLTLLSQARHKAPWVSVMVITGFGDIAMSVRAMKLGAVDFIEKPLNRKTFLSTVQRFLNRDDFKEIPANQRLTKMEKRVLKLVLEGLSNKKIAYQLDRSLRTVEMHRSHIMLKLGVDNIVELVKKVGPIDLDKID